MKNKYSLYETVKNILSFIYTKVFYKKVRLIRLPAYIRGGDLIDFGEGFTTGYNCRIECFPVAPGRSKTLIIGKNCHIGDYVHIAAGEQVVIGDDCLFASKIYISDISHGVYNGNFEHSKPSELARDRVLHTKKIIIGCNVWIGENVSVLPGAVIGNNVVIGANSVVNKEIPDNSIAVGAPARVIKNFDFSSNKWVSL